MPVVEEHALLDEDRIEVVYTTLLDERRGFSRLLSIKEGGDYGRRQGARGHGKHAAMGDRVLGRCCAKY